jgi:hypothetical protein
MKQSLDTAVVVAALVCMLLGCAAVRAAICGRRERAAVYALTAVFYIMVNAIVQVVCR